MRACLYFRFSLFLTKNLLSEDHKFSPSVLRRLFEKVLSKSPTHSAIIWIIFRTYNQHEHTLAKLHSLPRTLNPPPPHNRPTIHDIHSHVLLLEAKPVQFVHDPMASQHHWERLTTRKNSLETSLANSATLPAPKTLLPNIFKTQLNAQ